MSSDHPSDTKPDSPERDDHDHDHHHHGHGRHDHGGRFRKYRFLIVPMILAAVALKGAAVMLLWNALIPELFHGPVVTFPQALGLLVLAKLLTGMKPRGFGGHRRFKEKMWEKNLMTGEERKKLREHFRRKWEC